MKISVLLEIRKISVVHLFLFYRKVLLNSCKIFEDEDFVGNFGIWGNHMDERQAEKEKALCRSKYGKRILFLLNVILVLTAIAFSVKYSNRVREEQKETELSTFESTVESMKQISINYLSMELNYAKDWANYINSHDMTLDQALDYIRQANNQSDRYAHIVDMSTFQAYSTYQGEDAEELICYRKFYENQDIDDTNKLFMHYRDCGIRR